MKEDSRWEITKAFCEIICEGLTQEDIEYLEALAEEGWGTCA